MAIVDFSKEDKVLLAKKIKLYFETELDRDIGHFDAMFLLDFIIEQMGVYFYNRGLYDAQALFEDKFAGIANAVYELEKTTDSRH